MNDKPAAIESEAKFIGPEFSDNSAESIAESIAEFNDEHDVADEVAVVPLMLETSGSR
ncbi:MAG: hypothetical protein MUC43_05070 [Pirellula sp.]|jgi:hypothetical protein|nr:hypothetical protein [Pirellula sp.]